MYNVCMAAYDRNNPVNRASSESDFSLIEFMRDYPDDAAWEADFARVEALLLPFEGFQNTLGQAPANLLVKYRDKTSVTERIRRLLRSHLSGEMPSLEQVGRVLGMTPQTLRRRLTEEGQGFQSLKDHLRASLAVPGIAAHALDGRAGSLQ